MSHPAFRRDRRISIALPDRMAREELQVWLLVENPDGRWSEAVYVDSEELGVRSEELDDTAAATGRQTTQNSEPRRGDGDSAVDIPSPPRGS
jgi:hypothetical protein